MCEYLLLPGRTVTACFYYTLIGHRHKAAACKVNGK